MTNMQTSGTDAKNIPIGAKLQSAREMMRLDRKDAAAQLRLNENIIDMIETNSFPDDMPPIFIRGYIRSYGKLLQISDADIHTALQPITPKPAAPEPHVSLSATDMNNVSNHKYLLQGLTAGIALVLLWLVAVWWHGRAAIPAATQTITSQEETVTTIAPAGVSVQLARPAAAPTELPAPEEPTLAPRSITED